MAFLLYPSQVCRRPPASPGHERSSFRFPVHFLETISTRFVPSPQHSFQIHKLLLTCLLSVICDAYHTSKCKKKPAVRGAQRAFLLSSFARSWLRVRLPRRFAFRLRPRNDRAAFLPLSLSPTLPRKGGRRGSAPHNEPVVRLLKSLTHFQTCGAVVPRGAVTCPLTGVVHCAVEKVGGEDDGAAGWHR